MSQPKESLKARAAKEAGAEGMPPLKPIGTEVLSVKEIVGRLEELVRYVLECETRPMVPEASFVDVYKQLVGIREAIEVLSVDQQEMLSIIEASGITKEEMNERLSPEDKKMVSKLQTLQGICEAAKERLHRSMKRNPEAERDIQEKIRSGTTTKKQKIVHRKGKFKPLGGKEGWLPT